MSRRAFRKIISRSKPGSKNSLLPSVSENSSSTGSYQSLESRNDESNNSNHSEDHHHYSNHHDMDKSAPPSSSMSLPDDRFQMQIELAELRERIKLLDNGTSKLELLDLLQEKDSELQKKNEQIGVLNQKFHQITLGLDQMDQERKTLKQKSKMYEEERTEMERQLENREKEVHTLQSRCTIQEEKMREVHTTRSSMQKLSLENKSLQQRLSQIQKEEQANAKRLEHEKKILEMRVNELSCDNSAELEDLRNTISNYEESIQMHERREEQFNEKIASLANFKRQNAEMQKQHEKQLQALNQSFGKREVELESTFQSQKKEMINDREKVLEQLREKSSFCSKLERESKDLAKELRNLQSTIKAIHTEKKDIETSSFKLERENTSKSNTIAALRSELEGKEQQIYTLNDQVQELMSENTVIEDLEKQLKNLLDSLAQVQKQNAEQKEEDRSTIENLQRDLEEMQASNALAEQTIQKYKEEEEHKAGRDAELDEKLNDIEKLIVSKNELIAEKDYTISSLNKKIEKMNVEMEQKSVYAEKMKRSSEKVNSLVMHKQLEVNELKTKLESAIETETKKKAELEEMKKKQDSAEMQAAVIVDELGDKLEKAEAKVKSLERESIKAKEDTNQVVRGIQTQLIGSLNEKEELEKQMNLKLEQMNNDAKKQENDYKKALEEKEKSIESIQSKLLQKDETVRSLSSQMDVYENDKKRSDGTTQELKREIENLKSKHEEDVVIYRAEAKLLQSKVSRNQKQETANEQKLKEVKSELEQRTKLLGDLVSHNKELDNDLLEARSVVSELQEELNTYVKEKDQSDQLREAKEKELNDIRDEFSRRLQDEKDHCMELEERLQRAEEAISTSKLQSKELAKKEHENTALKDKISRQESYIQRLLQKQKESRRGMKPLSNVNTPGVSESLSY